MGHYYIWVLTTHSATEAQDTDTAKQIYLNALEISEPYNERMQPTRVSVQATLSTI